MERLTVKGFNYSDAAIVENMRMATVSAAMCRLAAYEDTGLGPQTISEILDSVSEWYDAHKEGRLVVLPCKVGDPVWFVDRDMDDPSRWEICVPQKITEVGTRGFWTSVLLNDAKSMDLFTPWAALGSEAFLSREAAETALKEREGA